MILPNHTVVTTLGLPEQKPYIRGWATASSNFCQVLYNLNILARSTTQTLPPHPTIPIANEGNSQTHKREENIKNILQRVTCPNFSGTMSFFDFTSERVS
ncbi:hypothetical protein K7X08_031367 [Anisodus acutangulus]|uniref:Uncharacterized protein n=1 Tax=Anisodus acutangulus TaxID=402998 RepID=A0A9Q1ML03_9SOLA|nr:hypothetical protein K7X08_031367 [Anisodus acutangulus]